MIKPRYERVTTIFCDTAADIADSAAIAAGVVVMLNPADTNADADEPTGILVSDGTAAYGLLAQQIIAPPDEASYDSMEQVVVDYAMTPLSVSQKAYAGTPVGVFICGGVFITDMYVADVQPGDLLYVTSAGLLTPTYATTPTTAAGSVPVAIAESVGDADGADDGTATNIRIKLLL
jgi:hypothetical protein